jgi:hypothetical protein
MQAVEFIAEGAQTSATTHSGSNPFIDCFTVYRPDTRLEQGRINHKINNRHVLPPLTFYQSEVILW